MNGGAMRPRGAGLLAPNLARVPSHCLLVEAGGSLILVDTGFGTMDMDDPSRLGVSNIVLNAVRDADRPVVRQVELLGFDPEDVRQIICTHLDRDHAGGLSDFPNASVHVLRAEYEAAANPATFDERDRYRKCHFEHGPAWVTHETVSGKPWFGTDCIRELPGLPSEIILVPLPGHTRGHCGVVIETGEGWLFHCGDSYYIGDELAEDHGPPLDIRCFRRIAHHDAAAARLTLERIRKTLKGGGGAITALASHDPGGNGMGDAIK